MHKLLLKLSCKTILKPKAVHSQSNRQTKTGLITDFTHPFPHPGSSCSAALSWLSENYANGGQYTSWHRAGTQTESWCERMAESALLCHSLLDTFSLCCRLSLPVVSVPMEDNGFVVLYFYWAESVQNSLLISECWKSWNSAFAWRYMVNENEHKAFCNVILKSNALLL